MDLILASYMNAGRLILSDRTVQGLSSTSNDIMEIFSAIHSGIEGASNVIADSATSELESAHIKKREEVLSGESQQRMGHDVPLNDSEKLANQVLMGHKRREYNMDRVFLPAVNFVAAKKSIEESPVYQMIKKMPKGAVLHIHDSSMVNVDWLIANATYRDQCYIGMSTDDDHIVFKFARQSPITLDYVWFLVRTLREMAISDADFDAWLKEHMTMSVPNIKIAYTDQNALWKKFQHCMKAVSGLKQYEGFFADYHYQAMMEAMQDNVQYMEIRASMDRVYTLDEVERDREHTMLLYMKTSKDFVSHHPLHFCGVKVIHDDCRCQKRDYVRKSIKDSVRLHRKYPDFYIGYDLVAQEDTGHTLMYYLTDLLYPRAHGEDLPYYLHAGETDWQGTDVDENLVDAVLLNSARIGHAYALPRHTKVMEIVKDYQIAIEVSPISNQILGLVLDLRNHPMTSLVERDFPIVISSDDPSIWNADILSHDFYEAFMALGGRDGDIRLLKKLAMNSIEFSGMNAKEKTLAFSLWSEKWDVWIKDIVGDLIDSQWPPQPGPMWPAPGPAELDSKWPRPIPTWPTSGPLWPFRSLVKPTWLDSMSRFKTCGMISGVNNCNMDYSNKGNNSRPSQGGP